LSTCNIAEIAGKLKDKETGSGQPVEKVIRVFQQAAVSCIPHILVNKLLAPHPHFIQENKRGRLYLFRFRFYKVLMGPAINQLNNSL